MESVKHMVKNKIKLLRMKKNITQIQIAKDLQVTRQTIIAIENHHYNPSLELSLKISKYFNKPVEEIFFLEEGGS
ncbi:transcriptional regulator [Bacillus thuringiensis]|nr:transcriptional regulator [Bacillus thuringiensis]